jgi:putative transposase
MSAISLKVGSTVNYLGKDWRIRKVAGISEVMVEEVKTKAVEIVAVADLMAKQAPPEQKVIPIEALAPDDLAEARRRFNLIEKILYCDSGRVRLTEEIAQQTGVGASTLRRWVHDYLDRGLLSDLAPSRKGRTMPKRLDKRVEALIAKVIEEEYLRTRKRSIRKAYEHFKTRAKAMKLCVPHESTFRARIAALPERLKVERRHGKKAARDRFDLVAGSFPGADYPLAVVQIDHTKLDIMLVDDETRQPIGRPWLTLAIDVFSRMVVGYYLSLDAPQAFSVGMCIAQAADRKDAVLQRLGIEGEWPVWGLMRVIHADNGKDFRSRLIESTCEQYGVGLAWRPVKKPHFGGHIERLMGTVATEIHDLPGTTFSNITAKGESKPEKDAIMTFLELERWLVQFIVNVYHLRRHGGIRMAPIERWRQGIMGYGRTPGIGLPDPLLDPIRFRRDWLPWETRVVGRDGIVWDKILYRSDALAPWVEARKGGRPVKFVVRRDPRDISKIYFLDPELKDYLEIPYLDTSKPSISLWEYREAERYLEARGEKADHEDVIFKAREDMAGTVAKAKDETKRVRRARQRKKIHDEAVGTEPSVGWANPPAAGGHLNLVVNNLPRRTFSIPANLGEMDEV